MATDLNETVDKTRQGANIKKFDLVVSNPPYQKTHDRCVGYGATSIYHLFMERAQELGNHVSLIYPAKWAKGGSGRGMVGFRQGELSSPHYVKFYHLPDATKVFRGVKIAGGVNFFLWDASKTTPGVDVYRGVSFDAPSRQKTLGAGAGGYVCYSELIPLIEKVDTKVSLSAIISPRNYYRIGSNDFAKGALKAGDKALSLHHIFKGSKALDKVDSSHCRVAFSDYKVFHGRAGTAPKNDKVGAVNNIFVGSPGELCSDSYLKVGSFATRKQAQNLVKYMRTRFFKLLMGAASPTQNFSRSSFSLVPLLDFDTGQILDRPDVFLDFDKDLDAQLKEVYSISDVQWARALELLPRSVLENLSKD